MINLGNLSLGQLAESGTGERRGRAAETVSRSRSAMDSEAALGLLLEETRAVSRGVRTAQETIHGEEAPSRGRRELLVELARSGPQTVPQLARRRAVTRQHVRALVTRLREKGYVELLANPAHRRSRLVGLTERGREVVSLLQQRERELLSAVAVARSGEELLRAAEVLRSVREALETGQG